MTRRVEAGRTGVGALAVFLWLLVGPPDRGGPAVWVIRGGYEDRAACEASRERSENTQWLLCVDATRPFLKPPVLAEPTTARDRSSR